MKTLSVPAINYESEENCFQKYDHITSRLIYGDPKKIEDPWITILIPTYRRPDMLKEALESVLIWQEHTDFFLGYCGFG